MLFNSFFSKKRSFILLSIVGISLIGCSSTPKKEEPIEQSQPVIKEEKPIIIEDASYRLAQAKALIASDPQQASLLMIDAANLYLEQKQYTNALWLTNQLAATDIEYSVEQQYQLRLIKARALSYLSPDKDLMPELEQADQLISSARLPHDITYYQLLSETYQRNEQHVNFLDTQLRIFALNKESNQQDIEDIWQKFAQLTQWQQQQISTLNAPGAQSWLQLTKLANQYGHSAIELSNRLTNWQRQHQTHAANIIANQLLEQAQNEQLNFEQQSADQPIVAILLPLSGKQARAGQAAQEGMLAAYATENNAQLHFIDTNNLDFTTLKDQLTNVNASAVIGPLLKAHVEEFLSLNLELPSLLLNIPSNTALNSHQMAISMRPEDEAIQAAAQLSDSNYQNPLILSHNDNVSQRISQAFANQWLNITGNTIESMIYSDGKAMQSQLKQSLSVDASQARIKNLRSRLKQIIKIESRNRRDIDMIYIVGNNAQTRLIKPYIDVNTSTFSDIIPIYASSRSHSLHHDDSAFTDLKNMKFTEMPWLLTSEQQNTPLSQQAKEMWPNRSDTLHRIFAMGFDALPLINKFDALKTKPYIRHFGQTGVLKLEQSNILTRSLLWGQYSRNKVQQLALVQ